jgi:hypothetical protein
VALRSQARGSPFPNPKKKVQSGDFGHTRQSSESDMLLAADKRNIDVQSFSL